MKTKIIISALMLLALLISACKKKDEFNGYSVDYKVTTSCPAGIKTVSYEKDHSQRTFENPSYGTKIWNKSVSEGHNQEAWLYVELDYYSCSGYTSRLEIWVNGNKCADYNGTETRCYLD